MTALPQRSGGHRRWLTLRVWGNPLARGCDRAEASLVVGLVVLWLAMLPVVAALAGEVWTGVDARLTAEHLTGTFTDAVLTDDSTLVLSARDIPMGATAPAEWAAADGRPASGVIDVLGGARSGDHVTIWLAADGSVDAPPMGSTAEATLTVFVAGGAWLTVGFVLWGVWWTVRRRLDGCRADRWQRDWLQFEASRKSP